MSKIIVNEKEYGEEEILQLIKSVENQRKQKQTMLNKLTNLQDKHEKLENNYDEFKKDYKIVVQDRNKLELKCEKKGMGKEFLQQFDKYKDFYNEWSSQVDKFKEQKQDNPVNEIYIQKIIEYEDKIKKQNEQIKSLQEENEKIIIEKNEKPQDNIYVNDDRDNIISTLKEELGELKAQLKSKKSTENNLTFMINDNRDKNKIIEKLEQENKKLKSELDSEIKKSKKFVRKMNTNESNDITIKNEIIKKLEEENERLNKALEIIDKIDNDNKIDNSGNGNNEIKNNLLSDTDNISSDNSDASSSSSENSNKKIYIKTKKKMY